MMSRSVFWSLLPGVVAGLTIGCAESDPDTPPVMDAIEQQQALGDAAEAARDRAAAENAATVAAANPNSMPRAAVPTEGLFEVEFDTTVGKFTIEVDREWAPVGAHRFYELVKNGFYNGCGFFRVVPGFMVQFGLAADPAVTARWQEEIPDDPVTKSNTRGYVTFAKTGAPDSRTTQMFINYGDNSRLDSDRFAPFGIVTKGMDIVDKISSAHGEDPDQGAIQQQGNGYLNANFPQLDYINLATLTIDDLE
ncbi:MAG: peptidylprolyl isomerase [Fuerstiella sp.]|jgi:peptidyl-prolyl cis-trans isomerase A (cyclophilin A)|nr:peptidylprolyl isomerase [Fuerstiella sp.]